MGKNITCMIFDWFDLTNRSALYDVAQFILNGSHTIIDKKTNAPMERGAEAREHYIRCDFCNKNVGYVPKRKGRTSRWGSERSAALKKHIELCGVVWLRDTMCKWSLNVLEEPYAGRVRTMARDVEAAKIWSDIRYSERIYVWDRMVPILPQPFGHPMTQALETGLALWAAQTQMDWKQLTPLVY